MSTKKFIVIALGIIASGQQQAAFAAALEEVVVTAQKTEETAQSIPISIQALDAKILANNSIQSLGDIKTLVPSLKFAPYPTAQENLLITLRGIPSSALELTQDTPTAVHINGVYIARGNGLNMSLADLERVEVLRGPQGTLYGRNATAGAINLITTKPTDTLSFRQQLTVAEHDRYISKTSINLPIADNLYTRISYLYDDQEGFVKNSAPNGIQFGDKNAQAARFELRWLPLDDLTVDYGYDRSYTRYYPTPAQCGEVSATGSFRNALDPAQCSDSFKKHIAFYGQMPKNTVLSYGHTLSAEWEFDAMTLRSITAYRGLDDKYYGVTLAGGSGLIGGTANYPGVTLLQAEPDHTRQGQFSQELQLVGDLGDQLGYTTGVYYFREHGTEQQDYTGAAYMAPIVVDAGPRDLRVTNKSVAAFGQLTWTPDLLDEKLEIIPGVRFTRDNRDASLFDRQNGVRFIANGATVAAPRYIGTPDTSNGLTGVPAEFSKDFTKTTPSLTLQYHISPDILTYGKYVKGYKSGGTAVRSSNTLAFTNGFNPEMLTSIELGLKSSWLDQRLRANIDVFQSSFKDQQVSVRNMAVAQSSATTPYDIINAGESTYRGAELELQAAVTDNLRLSANYSYLHFDYDKVEDPATGIDVSQYYHNVVPTNMYSIAADYSMDVGFAKLSANLNYSHTDKNGNYQDSYIVADGAASQSAPTDTRQFITPAYGIWNGRVALSEIQVGPGNKGRVEVALWGKNLADEEYAAFQGAILTPAAQYQIIWGEPRTLGLDVIYRYE